MRTRFQSSWRKRSTWKKNWPKFFANLEKLSCLLLIDESLIFNIISGPNFFNDSIDEFIHVTIDGLLVGRHLGLDLALGDLLVQLGLELWVGENGPTIFTGEDLYNKRSNSALETWSIFERGSSKNARSPSSLNLSHWRLPIDANRDTGMRFIVFEYSMGEKFGKECEPL
jgi:hypothetical protein